MKRKGITFFTAILCLLFMLVVYSPKQVLAETVNEVRTLNDTWLSDVCGLNINDVKWTSTEKSIVEIDNKTGRAITESRGTDYIVASIGSYHVKIKVTVR